MIEEQSFGVIPLRKEGNQWQVFLIKREKGFWECPKGHSDAGELPLSAAKRELFEETGLQVAKLVQQEPLQIQYFFRVKGALIKKTVFYYIAEVYGTVKLQTEEVHEGRWETLEAAIALGTYDTIKKVLRDVSALVE